MASDRLVASKSLEIPLFFFMNCSFLRRFLLSVEGLGFFFLIIFSTGEVAFSLVSRLKEKVEPMVREKEMVCPLFARAWQKSRHCFSRTGSPPLNVEVAIFTD